MDDWRLGDLARLGVLERDLTDQLIEVRAELAGLVVQLLPPHSTRGQVDDAVRVSGYSGTLLEVLRNRRHPWNR